MSAERDVAILGVGMHPWGKWGRDFTEYGMVAARAALDDAGLAWRDIQYVAGADTIRNGYPGFISGATFLNVPSPWFRYKRFRPPSALVVR